MRETNLDVMTNLDAERTFNNYVVKITKKH